ncbi:MAG TPA: signal recognition particle-docking protein FtsY [Alphaproteobacteria bacterium]|nr:signal recognition particle-docking protein FtsY [Alphaproteobacteria bacterium]
MSGWLARLGKGLGKSSAKIGDGISGLLSRRKLDAQAISELEDILIAADLGTATAARLVAAIGNKKFAGDAAPEEVKRALAAEITAVLAPVARPLVIDRGLKPHVILVCGVNGSGKTTTIGKLAKQYAGDGLSVMLAACDTFRAAAVEQLQVWGERANAPVVAAAPGADAAGLAYDAMLEAREQNADVLLIDTAGRLQNKAGLMAELEKIVRVIKKIDAAAPHDCLLVMDAGVGQNAHSQTKIFRDTVNVSGLVLTKLDGSARGGVVVALADKFRLPIHAIGIGEGADDLRPFKAADFANSLLGLDEFGR